MILLSVVCDLVAEIRVIVAALPFFFAISEKETPPNFAVTTDLRVPARLSDELRSSRSAESPRDIRVKVREACQNIRNLLKLGCAVKEFTEEGSSRGKDWEEVLVKGDNARFVALGSRLRGVREVLTLGVKPNFHDYTLPERQMILDASIILFPTLNYAQFFRTMGKRIFPSLETYLYADEKIKQTTLFYLWGIPHPRTRIYYHLHHGDILRDFSFPFVAKLPRASAQGRGVFKIDNREDLGSYLQRTHVAYIQEYLPHERDLRVILINYEPILAYWRVCPPGSFKTNIFHGGSFDFEDIPSEGIKLAQEFSQKCKFNDVGLDFIQNNGKWYLLEANMKYGRKGLQTKGMDLKQIMREKLLSGELTVDRG
jgi:ribosomal protein S6--L-glutamate ligase